MKEKKGFIVVPKRSGKSDLYMTIGCRYGISGPQCESYYARLENASTGEIFKGDSKSLFRLGKWEVGASLSNALKDIPNCRIDTPDIKQERLTDRNIIHSKSFDKKTLELIERFKQNIYPIV